MCAHDMCATPVPIEMGFTAPPRNPALPASVNLKPPKFQEGSSVVQYTIGTGAERIYPGPRNQASDFGHPPRPIPGSIADLDKILEQCDFGTGKVCALDCLGGANLVSAVRVVCS